MIYLLVKLYRRWQRNRAAAAGAQPAQAAQRTGTRSQSRPHAHPTTPAALVLHQARYDLLGVWRNRQARFFTLLLPLLFLVIFVSVFGNNTVGHQQVKVSTYYVPGIAALAVIASSFVNLVISVTTEREAGILKRRRATPVPAWVLVAGRTLSAMALSLAVMTLLIVVGVLAYGVHISASAIPAIAVTAIAGSVTFCVLAYALSSFIGSADSAQPVVQAVMLPLYFISGVFIPNVNLPAWLQDVARAFPVQHLANGLHTAFDPTVQGSAFMWNDIGAMLIWAAVGLAVALRRFSWLPATAGRVPA